MIIQNISKFLVVTHFKITCYIYNSNFPVSFHFHQNHSPKCNSVNFNPAKNSMK